MVKYAAMRFVAIAALVLFASVPAVVGTDGGGMDWVLLGNREGR